MKEVICLVLGNVSTNTYILKEKEHCIIFDPAANPKRILKEVGSCHVDAICLTHGHFDHIAGVDAFAKKYQCPVYINALDMPMLQDPTLNSSFYHPVVVNSKAFPLKPGINQIGAFTLNAIDAPGHSEGSTLLIWDDNLICGDVIFQGSIGRTDLITGSNTKMIQTLHYIRNNLSPDLKVYPGHGDMTTLDQEFRLNPYFQF